MTADVEGRKKVEDYEYKPSIHMPRWASRLTLEITKVRVERLQSISEEDAKAEGFTKSEPIGDTGFEATAKRRFMSLWDRINGKKHPWASNPWVWVIEFKTVEGKASYE